MTEAAAGFPFANGINASADGRTVYVASTLGREVRVYARDLASGELELRETIPVGSGPDNIEVDEEGALWIGAHPKLLQLSRYTARRERYAPAQVLRVTSDGDDWQVEEIYLDTGEALSASSVAAAHAGRLLIGAVRGDRFLDCRVF
jgi:arylesterase/paraoxonase